MRQRRRFSIITWARVGHRSWGIDRQYDGAVKRTNSSNRRWRCHRCDGGDHLANQNQQASQPQQHCETVNNTTQLVQGYNVTYSCHGIVMRFCEGVV